MRTIFLGLSAVALAAVASPALAQDEPTSEFTINGGATLVTDYRFRGISQTDKDFAVQGSMTVGHSSGIYATIWGSSIDDYIAGGSDQEIDFIVGWKKTFEGGTTVDLGVLYYYYPGGEKIIEDLDTDFFEPYVSVAHTFGPVTAKLTANYAPKQNAIGLTETINGVDVFRKKDNVYVAGDFSAAIPNTPISVSAHIGHSWGPSYLTIGDEYTDWNVGAAYTFKNLTFGVLYVDTDKSKGLYSPSGKAIADANVVGTIGVAF